MSCRVMHPLQSQGITFWSIHTVSDQSLSQYIARIDLNELNAGGYRIISCSFEDYSYAWNLRKVTEHS